MVSGLTPVRNGGKYHKSERSRVKPLDKLDELDDSPRNDLKSSVNELIIDIEEKVKDIKPVQLSERCIYRVPATLHRLNEEAYTPRMVSIGPFHHRGQTRFSYRDHFKNRHFKKFVNRAQMRFSSMDHLKNRYFKKFVKGSGVSLIKCFEFLQDCEARAREFYDEVIEMGSDDFVRMMLVDACFILELLLKSHCRDLRDAEDEYIMSMPWLRSDIRLDLILLENQIPFFVLEGLFDLATINRSTQLHSLLDLSLEYFKKYNKLDRPPNIESVKHFTDLILILHRPDSSRSRPDSSRSKPRNENFKHVYSATELDEAGVKFQVSEKNCFLEVNFNKNILEIPCFELNDHTETLFRNLMALELCHYPSDSYIIDYILFMDYLINTPKDVDLLVQNRILVNLLGDSKAAARLFNNLCINIKIDYNNFYFFSVCDALNKYYEARIHKLKAMLKRDYFNTPWQAASTIAAFTLLVLTVIQTVCSIVSVNGS